MQKIRMGVLGVSGHFISRVIPALQKSKIVSIQAIASRSPEKSLEASRKYGIPEHFPSYDELLGDKNIDFVYIPLPNHLHAEWIKKAADAGKHVICEKPLTLNAKDAQSAADYAAKKGIKLMEAFMYRFHYQWITVSEIVKNGSLGTIRSIETFFGFNNTNPDDIRNIREYGGGAILDIGCYAVSSARFILGSEPLQVSSLITEGKDFRTDIITSGIMDFGEARAVFTVSTQTYPWQKVIIHGSTGVLTVEIPFNPIPDKPMRLSLNKDSINRTIYARPCDHYRLQFDSFAKAVIENADVPIPVTDTINNMKVLDAIFSAGRSGKWEKV